MAMNKLVLVDEHQVLAALAELGQPVPLSLTRIHAFVVEVAHLITFGIGGAGSLDWRDCIGNSRLWHRLDYTLIKGPFLACSARR